MMHRNARAMALASTALLLSVSCAHGALIETDPPGAELYVNGTQVGVTPYTLQDTVGSGDRYEIVLQKPGYKIVQQTLIQDQFSWPRGVASIACGACTLGVGCLGLMWSWQLEDRYAFVLEPSAEAGGPASAPATEPAPVEPTEEEAEQQGNVPL